MNKLTKTEVATYIRNFISDLISPVIIAPKYLSDKNEAKLRPGAIITCSDVLIPAYTFRRDKTEELKILVELYKVVSEDS